MKDKWAEEILARFRDREVLSKDELFLKYFAPLNIDERNAMECFDEVEFEYSIPVGVLRPEDKLTKLTESVTTRNPLKWIFWRSRSELREADLLDELSTRLKKYGTTDDWETVDTFGEFVRAWSGKRPDHSDEP